MSKLKSVVVNYDEKAFLFNVSAGETVDRMQTRLAEVYSIPLDQQQLYVASPQLFQEKEKDLSNVPASIEFKIDIFREFNCQNFPFLPQIYNTVDYFILDLRPTLSSLLNRKVVLEYVKKTLSKCLGARAFCVGSSMNNVFLPDEMMEVTPFLCKGQEDKWVLRVNEGLCSAAFSSAEANGKGSGTAEEGTIDDSNITVNSVTFNCKSSCVMADINNMNVKISQNQLEALYNGALLEDINFICKKSSLFKKSLLLIKSWCSYDSKQFSPNGKTVYPDVLPPFVLDIMVVHIISRYGDAIEHPLHTLGLFLQFFAFLDFKSVVITMTDLLSISTMEPLVDEELKAIKEQKLANEINMKYRVLFNGYRHRYEATVTANRRAKEESVTAAESVAQAQSNNEGLAVEEAIEKNKTTGISWGMSSENPSLTVDFKPPPSFQPSSSKNANTPSKIAPFREEDTNAETFPRSFMNVIGPFKPNSNIANLLESSDIHELTSLLQCGLKRFEQTMHTCRLAAANNPRGCVDMGEGIEIPIESYFIGECFGLSRDKIVVEKKIHGEKELSDADAIEELRMSKYYCEVESPEDVLRHAELIMGSKITADAVANLIVHIIEQMGPLPIGEIGKLLQEFTGNQNLSRILKSQFRGLKKLIEGYPSSLMVGGDHNFNPHVYLARSKPLTAPDDPWIDEKKINVSQSQDMLMREAATGTAPPGLQVQHEQQQQQQLKPRSKAPPAAQSTPPRGPVSVPVREDPPMGFQLSATSPAFVAPPSGNNNSIDPWRDPHSSQQQGSRNRNPAQSHVNNQNLNMNTRREYRLPSKYYGDDRIDATETAFLTSDHYREERGGGETYRPHSNSGGHDGDNRSQYAPKGISYYGSSSRGRDLSEGGMRMHFDDNLSQHHQQQQQVIPQERDKALSSLMGLSTAHYGRLDQDYVTGQFQTKKYTPADYIEGLHHENGSSSSSGVSQYARDIDSSHDGNGNVSSIFAPGDYSRPGERGPPRVDSSRHPNDRHPDRYVDRGDRQQQQRSGERYSDDRLVDRHVDLYFSSSQGGAYQDYDRGGMRGGRGGGGGGSDRLGPVHDRGGMSNSHFYPSHQGGQSNHPNYLHSSEDSRGGGGGGGPRLNEHGGGSGSVGNNNMNGNHSNFTSQGQSPVDSNMLPYFLRDS